MKTAIIVLSLLVTTTVSAIENRTSTLPWTDYPAHNPPTAGKFCDDIIGNPKMTWSKRSSVTCQNLDGIVLITGTATNRDGEERTMTISANETDVMYMEESGDVMFKYANDQEETLFLSTQFVTEKIKKGWFGVEEVGYYKCDMIMTKGTNRVRVGFTDLE